jgi:membrane-bound metal-dependent hydrolase YbcI (DUF457 family)
VFVGHAMLAFALVAGAASLRDVDPDRALVVGAVAGAFATVPDVDMVYALVGVLQVGVAGLWGTVEAFWSTGNVVHRSVTHSLVLAVPVSVAAALGTYRPGWPVAGGLLVALVVWVGSVDGVLAGAVAAAAFVAAAAVALFAAEVLHLGPRAVFAAALTGLVTHPPGDLFTGEPPALLYPLDVTVLQERVALHPDPTLHLLGVFALELTVIWLAAAVYLRLHSETVSGYVDPRAGLGVLYGGVALVLPAPTLEVSYQFVFTVLAVGSVGFLVGRRPWTTPGGRRRAALTALAAVTVAGGAYTVAYVAL